MNPREIMLRIYVGVFIAALAIFAVVLASAFLREEGFPVMHWLWNVAIPMVIETAWTDPLYILAAIFVVALLWCLPYQTIWESLSETGDEESSDDDPQVRRGRQMASTARANRKAYEELTRHVTEQQRKRLKKRQ